MKNIISYIRDRHDLLFKTFLTLLCIAAVVFILPKDIRFKYQFQKGKPWLHESLIAPFDFPIYKQDEVLEAEIKAIKEETPPCFRLDHAVAEKALQDYSLQFEEHWLKITKKDTALENPKQRRRLKKKAVKKAHYDFGETILTAIYDRGIVKVDDVIEGVTDDFEITVLNHNFAEDKEISELHTIQSAFDYVDETLATEEDIVEEFLHPLLEGLILHNLFYDQETTEKIIQDKLDNLSLAHGVVLKNEKIIDRGDVITEDLYQKLISLRKEYENELGGTSSFYVILTGQIILVGLLVIMLIFFLSRFRKDVITENNKVSFILILLTLMVYMAAISVYNATIHIYALPFCILPVIIRTFYGIRLATLVHIIAIFLIGLLVPNGFEFILIQYIAGVIAVFWLANLRKRSQLFSTSLLIFFAYSLTYFGMATLQEGEWHNINVVYFAWFGVSALLTLFAYPLMFILEKTFGFMSDISLMELSDTNSPALRELATKAPGTFQHSLQVGNLAEEAVRHIGGNPLLVRTGALYHDIGKIHQSMYFIENQVRGINPHDEISPEESAAIIIGHVIKGIEMAKQHKLPEQIIDFIRTHHGTTHTRFFYAAWKKDHPDKEPDENLFQYPGPIPYSRETAILMMADSVEAAARSLKQYDAETISNLVDGIIDTQAKENQFQNANITFRDITEIKKIFKRMLMNIYHVRIEYPK